MDKKLDLRIQKTYKALFDAFLPMLEEKRFEDITVNELCERAMVRRATFYKHFADKYDFFAFFIRQVQDSFNARSDLYIEDDQPCSYYIYLFRECIRFLDEHKKLMEGVVKSNLFPTLLQIFSDEVYRNVLLRLNEKAQAGCHLPVPAELLASLYTGAVIQTLRYWVTSPKPISEEELINDVTKVLSSFHFT